METDGSRQLKNLNIAIKLHPDAPINYLLRGESWLRQGELDRAEDDLMKASQLAKDAILTSDWEYLLQSYLDRIEEMLVWIGQQKD